ncbi:hypothetical protein [Azospirillum soli]|uniref:hypothetical protein n=1 Tax=Azospirillum soli TaxID=1304799 RepID=UPI001AE2AF1B|nr:hypothetical protein [Azospirillum soli]MBP2316423.1 hypothetical protein [Azospirillum soli]
MAYRLMMGLAAVMLLAGTGMAEAAPPRCENITVEDMRRNCFERVERCEPLKSAAERDECYRGTKPNANANASSNMNSSAAQNGPIRLTRPDAAAGSAPPPPPAPPPAPAPVVVRPNQPPVIASPPPVPQAIPQPAPKAEPVPAPVPAPVVVRPAPPVPVSPAAVAPAPRPPQGNGIQGTGLDAVRGFYDALAQADGARANGFLVPEKRNSGAYEITSLSRFYGAMREPLRLLSADPIGPDAFRVRYHYVYVNGRVCDGGAEVTLSRREGALLIERIKALNGC